MTKRTFFIAGLMMLPFIVTVASAAELQVTTTVANGHYLFESDTALTWTFRGPFIADPSGKRLTGFASPGAMVVVARLVDGTIVQRIILPDGNDVQPPPTDKTLTAKVRKLSARLPKAERVKIAKIHSDLAKIAGTSITGKYALFEERRIRFRDTLTFPNDPWADWVDAVNKLLNKIGTPPGMDGPAGDFVEAFKQIAEGLVQ